MASSWLLQFRTRFIIGLKKIDQDQTFSKVGFWRRAVQQLLTYIPIVLRKIPSQSFKVWRTPTSDFNFIFRILIRNWRANQSIDDIASLYCLRVFWSISAIFRKNNLLSAFLKKTHLKRLLFNFYINIGGF